MEIKIK